MKMTFNDVLIIKNGKNQRAVENPKGRYPIYGSGGAMGFADDYICTGQTVVIGRKGSINNPIFVEEPFWNVDTAFGLEANERVLSPKYLFYFCKHFDFGKLNKTVTIPSLTKSDLLKIEIDLPSLQEQRIVVEILHKVESIIHLRKQELQSLDNLIKARFVEMFGDPVLIKKKKKKLSDIGRIFTGNTPTMKNPEYYDSDDIPFVKPGDIAERGVTRINRANSSISEKARNATRIMPPNAVLVTCIGTIGKIGIATQECCCNQQINYIVPNDEIDSVYLAYCISFFKDILSDMANAPVVPIINKTQFSALEIPVAENGKQIQFSEFVSQIDKSKFAVQKALDEARLLFDSLMQKYFG